MIINFAVENFGPIKDKVELSFKATKSDELEEYYVASELPGGLRILKLGLIYGANASGKTTILNALEFLRRIVLEPLGKKTESLNFKPFLFDEKTPLQNSIMSLEFLQNNVKYLYNIEFNKKAVIKEELYKQKKALVYRRKTDIEKQLSIIEFGQKLRLQKKQKVALEANTLWNNTVLGGSLKTNIDSPELKQVTSWFKQSLKPIITPQTNLFVYISKKINDDEISKKRIAEFMGKADYLISDIIVQKSLKELTEEEIDEISKLPLPENVLTEIKEKGHVESIETFFQHKLKDGRIFRLPYGDESAGTQRYYQLSGLLSMLLKRDSVVFIDELESSLHPDLVKHFLLMFLVNCKNSQLIATTHYRELLMEKDILRNDSIWFTEKRDDGGTDLFSLKDFDSSVVRNTSSIYNAYKIGKLGAKPNLGDYYLSIDDEQ